MAAKRTFIVHYESISKSENLVKGSVLILIFDWVKRYSPKPLVKRIITENNARTLHNILNLMSYSTLKNAIRDSLMQKH